MTLRKFAVDKRSFRQKMRMHFCAFFSWLGLSMSLALAILFPTEALAQKNIRNQADVIIIGGGLAGLSAARSLTAQDFSVIVLEASDRVGGRTWTTKLPDGGWIDMGGQWTGLSMGHIAALADSLGVKTFSSYCQGNNIFIFEGKQMEYSSSVDPGAFPLPEADLKEYRSVLEKLDSFAAEIPIDAPWNAPHALEWDSQTVATWIRDNISTSGAKFLMRIFTLGYFASEPKDVSFLHFLLYIRAGQGFQKVHTFGNGLRFIEGAQQISEKIAQQLGDRMILNAPVQEIDQTGDAVVVLTAQGRFEAKRVIVAMAPPLAARIFYRPKLPADRDQFTQRAPLGSTIKVHAVYPNAFWRKNGLSGKVISENDDISFAVDNSPPNGEPGILGGFIQGQNARLWANRSDEDLKKMVLETFVKYYGPEAGFPTAFYKADWNGESWSRGGFGSVLPAGVWTSFPNVIRDPVGRIHWAGTETAIGWYSSMNGAVSSGERAAREVIEKLSFNN
jgi:monoamine oxidase